MSSEKKPHVHGPHCNHGPAIAPVQKIACPGRNEPCWCGSEKKYKKCHLREDEMRVQS